MNEPGTSAFPVGTTVGESTHSVTVEGSTTEGLKGKVGEKWEEGKSQAQRLGSQYKDKAIGKLDEKKGAISSQIDIVADSLDTFCRELEEKGVPAQQILGSASGWLRNFAADLDTNSTQVLMERVQGRFRQNPGPFLAGIAALGFVGARFLRR